MHWLNYILLDKDAGTHLFLKTRRMCHGKNSLFSNTIFPRHPLWGTGETSGFWATWTFDLTQQDRGTPHCHASYTKSSPEHSDYILSLRRTEVDQNWLCQFEFFNTVSSAALPCSSTWTSYSSKICFKSFWRRHFSRIGRFNLLWDQQSITFHSWNLIYFFQISFYVLVSRTYMSRN